MTTTNLNNEATAPANVRPSSVSKTRAFAAHRANRELSTQTVLDLLKAQLPTQYELVEIVGRWIWLDFPAHTHRAAANVLWRFGFHWNQRRCVWQHPCGAFAPYAPHGAVEIDNNLVENMIRPTAVGKRNWLFFGSEEAGARSAVIYTLVANCRLHGIEPYQPVKKLNILCYLIQ